jgi:hypothetical protein
VSSNAEEPNYGYRIGRENKAALEAMASPMPLKAGADFEAPEEIDPRPWHRIEMQGGMGSCQGHALSSVCEMAYHIATGEVTQFSPLFAYLATQEMDGLLGRDAGSTIYNGMNVAKRIGMLPLDLMPYPNPVRYPSSVARVREELEAAYKLASPFRIRNHAMCKSYSDVFNFIASGQGGVSIGIQWGPAMTPNREGVIERFAPGPGGHAVAFLGYSKRRDTEGRKYLWLANSWDRTWGNNGWAEVSPTAVDQMGQAQWSTMVGLSDLTVPMPRKVDWRKDSVFE